MVKLASKESEIKDLFRELNNNPKEIYLHHLDVGGIDYGYLEANIIRSLSKAMDFGVKVLVGYGRDLKPNSFLLMEVHEKGLLNPSPFVNIPIWSNFSKTPSGSKNALRMFGEASEIAKSLGCKRVHFGSSESSYSNKKLSGFFINKGLIKTSTQYTKNI